MRPAPFADSARSLSTVEAIIFPGSDLSCEAKKVLSKFLSGARFHAARPRGGPQAPSRTKFTQPTASDGLEPEVQADQREDEALEVLYEVVEDAERVGLGRVLHVEQRADLRRRERDMLAAERALQLLPPVLRGWGGFSRSLAS